MIVAGHVGTGRGLFLHGLHIFTKMNLLILKICTNQYHQRNFKNAD
jgi:hypothetical protein